MMTPNSSSRSRNFLVQMRASCFSKTTIPLLFWTAAFLTVLGLGLTQLYRDGINAGQPGSVPSNSPNTTDRYVSNSMQAATILLVIVDMPDLVEFGRCVSGHRRQFSNPQLGYC